MEKKKSLLIRMVIWHRLNSRPILMNYKWIILLGLALSAIIMGSFGFREAALSGNLPTIQNPGWMDFIFLSLRLFSLQTANAVSNPPGFLAIARVLAPAIAFCTILLVVTSSLYERFAIFWFGFVRRNHTIVCGLGYLGPIITKTLINMGYSVVVIEKDADNPELDTVRDLGALVIIGDAASKDTLDRAHLSHARGLFAVTGDDAKNIAIYMKCDDLLEKLEITHPFNCYIHIEDRNLYRIYDSKNLGKFCPHEKTTTQPGLQCSCGRQTFFFNLYWSAASCLLQQYPFILPDLKARLSERMEICTSKEHHPIHASESGSEIQPPAVNFLVAGVGTFGESLILEAAFEWWVWFGRTDKKLNIILLDKDAIEKGKNLTSRYPSISKYCNFELVDSDVLSSKVTEGSFLFNPDKTPKVSNIFICFADETLALTAAVHFRKLLGEANVPIVFRTVRDEPLKALNKQNHENDTSFQHLFAFPIASCECCMDEILYHGTDERLAMRIHQNYLRLEFSKGNTLKNNPTLVPWKDLSHGLKETNRRQANNFMDYLDKTGYTVEPLSDWKEPLTWFTDEEIKILSIEEHKNWVQNKLSLGYAYGPRKSEERKTNPCITAWSNLPEDEKAKDRDAVRAIPRLFAEIGQRVVKNKSHTGKKE